MESRESFKSKIGAIFVSAGSAVGLGSIWRFPYITGENGGGAFLMVFTLCVLILGIPVMLAEFSIGSYTRLGGVKAYRSLKKGWEWLGYNGILVAVLISGFYYIVSGWGLYYLIGSIDGTLYSSNADFHEGFVEFCSSWRQVLYTLLFIIATHIIVSMGVQNGIERISKFMVPCLLLILIALAIKAASMSGAEEGYKFLFTPDFNKALSAKTLMCAIGQAFFCLSIGIGCMITYSSYFKRGTDLSLTSFSVAGMTIAVSVLCGIVIFPAVFSVPGLKVSEGPTLIFETLPHIFAEMTFSSLWSAVFFMLVVLAALTSTISFHEVITQYYVEKDYSRKTAAHITTSISIILSLLCCYKNVFFDIFDTISADILMPLGGLLTSIFAGWFFSREMFLKQMTIEGQKKAKAFPLLVFALKWVCPALLITIICYKILNKFIL